MNKKIVAFVSNTSWFLYNFRRKTIIAFRNKGYRVVCIAPHDAHSPSLTSELGVEYVRLDLEGKSTHFLGEARSFFRLFNIMKSLDPCFVFNFTIKCNIYSGLICRILGIPYSNNVSGLGTAFIHNSWLFRQVRKIYGVANAGALRLFFENPDDLRLFEEQRLKGKAESYMIPGSGINTDYFRFTPLHEKRPFTFVMIARLVGDKGVREYAKASQHLAEEGLPVRCQLVGPLGVSNRTAILEDEVKIWEKSGFLEYLGETHDVRPLIAKSHVLVLPSYREGMPRTVLEAAAMGRPAIVTDVPGCRHAIEPGVTGWLCELKNVDSLAGQMRACVNMDHDQLQQAGYKARQRMEEQFSEEIVVQAYLDCLRKAGIRPS